MYRIILLVILLALPVESNLLGDEEEILKEKEKINGGFKTCTIFTYDQFNGMVDSSSKRICGFRKYDEIGNMIEKTRGIKGEKFNSKQINEYDSNGYRIKSIEFNSNGSIDKILIMKNDSYGKDIEILTYNNKKILERRQTTVYDDQGRMIEAIDDFDPLVHETKKKHHRKHISILIKTTFKYDEQGYLIENCLYETRNKILERDLYRNDDKGNRIELLVYDSVGQLQYTQKYDYIYDNKGKIIEEKQFIPNNPYHNKFSYKYDDLGNEIENIEYSSNGSIKRKYTCKYDKNNNLLEYCDYPPGNIIYKITREYDNYGNMSEEKGFTDNELQWIYLYIYSK